MNFEEQLRSFEHLGGQSAPLASNGVGVRVLYRCDLCHRLWLQDGKTAILDLSAEQVQTVATAVSADLEHLPVTTCRLCLWRTGGNAVNIDEYDRGEGFGFCWEIVHPLILHATSAILSQKAASQRESRPDVLTRPAKLRAVLHKVTQAQLPRQMPRLPAAWCALHAAELRPGFGQTGTERWQWQGWSFQLACPPLDERAIVSLMLATPPAERVTAQTAFRIWQFLMELTLHGAIPDGQA